MAAEVEAEADESVQYPAFYKVMMDKLNEQRQLDQFTDITLIVDGHQFRAHKAVLAACSQFFHKFFQDFTQEPLVEIEGVSNTAFRQLMEFTYTATLSVTGDDEAQDVWKAAEYLQMQEALKALESRTHEKSSPSPKRKGKKRKIAETSNVITETLPLVEGEQVEIEVIGEEAIEEEVVKSSQDDSALALLADITSKYQHGESTMHVIKKGELEEEIAYQEETVTASKVLENVEVVEVQISQVDNMFRCDKCDRSFKLYYFLKQHLKTHTGTVEKPHICSHCGKAYTREGALKQHVTTFHSEAEELNKNQKPQKKMHVCEYCQKNFDHFGHFKEHLRKHTGEKPYECPDCHERFARNSTLKCHMTACQNGVGAKKGRKKIYECQVCNSVFNVWEEFKDHLVSHTGDKPNHCTVCDVWFTHPKDLQEHLRDTHNIDDPKTGDDLLVPDPSLALSAQSMEAGEMVVLEEGIHMDVMETATVMVDEQGVAEMCEEDVERLKRAGVEIQVVQVNSSHVEEVEEEVEEEMVTVEQVQEEVQEGVQEEEEQGAVV